MFIDTHSHLNLEQFEHDWKDCIQKLVDHSTRVQTVGVDVSSSNRALEISSQFSEVSRAIVGIHPAYVEPEVNYSEQLEQVAVLAANILCVGVGECGFDYFRKSKDVVYASQKHVFLEQIKIAKKFNKPVMLHIRPTKNSHDAYDDALEILQEFRGVIRGQAHFFAGTIEQMERFIDLGFYISCTGVVTFTDEYDELIKNIPLDRLLFETDSPYVAPVPFRGSRCEPSYVKYIYERVALLRGLTVAELERILEDNVKSLYGW